MNSISSKQLTFAEIVQLLLRERLLLAGTFTGDSTPLARISPKLSEQQPGSCFLAYPGVKTDGHQLIPDALAQGAVLLIGEHPYPDSTWPVPYLQVTNAREAWSWLEAEKAGNPQRDLSFIGVTGTNGKTSIVWMVRSLLAAQQIPCLSLGTLGAFLGQDHVELLHTTPDPDVLFPLLARAKASGIEHVVMEVASHSISQKKISPLSFLAAAFSSFSQDHLDFHSNMDAYWNAKAELFLHHLHQTGRAVLSAQVASRLLAFGLPVEDTWVYGTKEMGLPPCSQVLRIPSTQAIDAYTGESVLSAQHAGKIIEGKIPFLGIHNQENFLAALILVEKITHTFPPPSLWQQVSQIPGRFERIQVPNNPLVVVDFAHTPDALAITLALARQATRRKLWVVFGCGGDRDRSKRRQMGAIAAQCADEVCLTSDNPRSEEPLQIIAEILQGTDASTQIKTIEPREEAIRSVILQATPEDVVVIAGKGHEAFQIYKHDKRPFSDQKVALACMKEKEKA